jgi:hypothetical protein
MPNVLERLKQVRRTQTQLVDALRRELQPLGFSIVPTTNAGSSTGARQAVGQFRCSTKGCPHVPFLTKAALVSHERSHALRAKASRKAATKKSEAAKKAE